MKSTALLAAVVAGITFIFYPKQVDNASIAIEQLAKTTQAAEAKLLVEPLTTQEVVDLCNAFKATLSATQITTLELAYTLSTAQRWSNLPQALVQTKRLGLPFSDLSATQLAAAKALLKSATGSVSNEGYDEVIQLLAADDYLSVNGGGATYGMGNYYIAFLGAPSLTGTWELQFGGHHLAVANTYKNGNLVGATPSFRAVEPFAAFASGTNSYEPIRQERDALAAMLNSLTTAQATTAKLSSTFSDIVLGPGKDWQFPTTKQGLQCNALNATQKAAVLAAIRTYVDDIDTANARLILAKYSNELDQTYVAFSGNASLTVQNDYVRIDGPSVWIEYSVQGGIVIRNVPHPHSVWRDRTGDYGGTGNPVGVKNVNETALDVVSFPNPVSNLTTIRFTLRQDANVRILIYDAAGRLALVPFHGKQPSGNNAVTADLSGLSAGSYIYTVEVDGVANASKTLVKQ